MKIKHIFLFIIITIVILTGLFYIFNKNQTCSKTDNSVCKIKINGNNMYLKVAYSKKRQARGLMHIKKLKENEGMIFINDTSRVLSFWMKNTLIPLSIAYVEEDGKISEIINMYPTNKNTPDYEKTIYPSTKRVKYAIEMNQGWFDLRAIKAGDFIKIPEALK